MLGRLLILGKGRGKTGAATWWIGHNTSEQITGTVAQCRRGSLSTSGMTGGSSSGSGRSADVGWNGLDAARFQFMSQHSDFGLVTGCDKMRRSETG